MFDHMNTRKAYTQSLIAIAFFSIFIFACKNEKTERKLMGDWQLVNSTLSLMDSNTVIHESEYVGNISFNKDKIDNSLIDLNNGNWKFNSFPDTIIPVLGNLSWTSTDKGDYKEIPWELDIYFSREYVKDFPVQGSYYFDSYQGKFTVMELKKNNHYKINGYIFKPNKPYYTWVFELKS